MRPAGVPARRLAADRPTPIADKLLDAYAADKAAASAHLHLRAGVEVPGYTGYIPQTKEVAGRPRASIGARYAKHGTRLSAIDALPSDPHTHDVIARLYTATVAKDMRTTLVGRSEAEARHLPGYTGHVHGRLDAALGHTFGTVTMSALSGGMPSAKEARRTMIAAGSPHAEFPFLTKQVEASKTGAFRVAISTQW